MYFGLGNFPANMGFINNFINPNPPQPQQPHQQRQQQPPHHHLHQNQNNQPNNNGLGFLNGLNNFINENFMNPLNNNRQQNNRDNQQQPRQSYSRRVNNKTKQKMPSPQKEAVLTETSGLYWKKKGNQAYKNGNFTLAIQLYNRAIEIDSTESVFFSNRAQCYKKLGFFDDALKDAQESIELDSTNVKAHKIAGQILAELGKKQDNTKKIENSIIRFRKALSLGGGKKATDEAQISRLIYLAKKVLFYINFNAIRNSRIAAINEYKKYLDGDDQLEGQMKELKMKQFIEASNQRIQFIIPDYLVCQITFQIMEDPVVTDSGQTYEREAIELHIQKNGKTDPFTRKPIKGPLYPCITIKKAVQQFLQRNPWAFEYSQGQNYKEIKF